MAVIEIRDDNSNVLFVDSEGWNQTIRKEAVSLRTNTRTGILTVYDKTRKWFDIDPTKVSQPAFTGGADGLRREIEKLIDGSQNNSKRSPFNTLFARTRISEELFKFVNRFEYDEEPRFWDIVENVNGSVNFNSNENSVSLQIGSAAGDKLIRQTRSYFKYSPGKETRAKFGILLEPPKAGLRQRYGIFNETDGIFIEVDGLDVYAVRRSNATGTVQEERIHRTDWNEDVLDGQGKSKADLDLSKIQMALFSFNWYGAGGAAISFVINGEVFSAHFFDAGNRLSEPIFGRPVLPLRYEIENLTATDSSSEQRLYGATVSEDGGKATVQGRSFVADSIAGVSVDDSSFTPVLSIRPKLTVDGMPNRATLSVISIELASDIDLCEYLVLHDAQISNQTFTDNGRFIEKSVNGAPVTLNRDDIVAGGFIGGNVKQGQIDTANVNVRFPFTVNFDATKANELAVVVKAISGTGATVQAIIRGLTEF